MPANANIAEFIEKALASGVSQQTLVGILTARGWPEKAVYDALAEHYQRLTGLEIPRRTAAGASAKDAFFYLLIFSTLATWTIAFGCLAFTLIDRWLADPLFYGYQQSVDSYVITYSLAAMIVAFPLYLLISRAVLKEAALHPEKLDSSVRKWLTYMALVIAASVFMGDLITALALFLRGEFTSRFVGKSLVVLLLSGGVFFYYFGGLRKVEAASGNFGRDRLMAVLSAVMVAILVIVGFTQSGPPSAQRALRADSERVQQLYNLANQVNEYWRSHDQQLPAALAQLPNAGLDPVSRAPYEYHPAMGSQYSLCANFAHDSDPREGSAPNPSPWIHSAGHHCFPLDARATPAYQTPHP